MVNNRGRLGSRYHARKSTSCVLRTLDNLPMRYSRGDSQRLAYSCRSVRTAHMETEQLARRTSNNLMANSKRLFEEVVDRVRTDTGTPGGEIGRWASVPHTGPTRYGSPLYNQSRADSALSVTFQPPPQYFKATQQIVKTLQKSQVEYRVVLNNKSSQMEPENYGYHSDQRNTLGSYPDFILIPNLDATKSQEDAFTEDNVKNVQMTLTSRKGTHAYKQVASLFPEPATVRNESISRPKNSKEPPDSKEDTVKGLKNNTKQKENTSSSSKQSRTHGEKDLTTEEKLPNPADHKELTATMVTKEGAEKLPNSAENTVEKNTTPAPQLPISNKDNPPTSSNQVTANKQLTVASSSQKKSLNKRNSKKGSKEVTESSGSLVKDVDRDGLPGFVCPSSEEKSKEARTRTWLRQTTFSYANRHVPLV